MLRYDGQVRTMVLFFISLGRREKIPRGLPQCHKGHDRGLIQGAHRQSLCNESKDASKLVT